MSVSVTTIVERDDGIKMDNSRGTWDWAIFSKVIAMDDDGHELSKSLCWNVFNAGDELVRQISASLVERKLINAGEAAKAFASRSDAIGLPKLTKMLLDFHRFCVTCPSTVPPIPATPVVVAPKTTDTVKPAPQKAPKKVTKKKKKEQVDSEDEDEEMDQLDSSEPSEEEEEEEEDESEEEAKPKKKAKTVAKKPVAKGKKVVESKGKKGVKKSTSTKATTTAKKEEVPVVKAQTRGEFFAQFAIDMKKAIELAEEIKLEFEEAEEWILRWYEEKPLRDQDKVAGDANTVKSEIVEDKMIED